MMHESKITVTITYMSSEDSLLNVTASHQFVFGRFMSWADMSSDEPSAFPTRETPLSKTALSIS